MAHHIYSPPLMGSQTVSHAQNVVSHVTSVAKEPYHVYSPPLMGFRNVPHTIPNLGHPSPSPSFSDVTGILAAGDIKHHAVVTPIDATCLHHYLQAHPNRHLTNYLVDAFRGGFRIGHKGPRIARHAPNLTSAFVHPQVIDRALAKEVSLGRIAGPFSSPPFANLQCSGLGLVPKDGADRRLIFHLSAPEGASVNDFISPDEFSLRYHTIDDAMDILHGLGPNALMGKADLKSAFRLCPVSPIDWPLLGIHWRGQFFVDKCLPFGLRSSPYLFNLLADALQWCLQHHFAVLHSFHYLDDFFFAGPADTEVCNRAITSFLDLCDTLHVPLKPEKLVLPCTQMTFLGIQLDSTTQVASIPPEKLDALLKSLRHHLHLYRSGTTVPKRSLLSLIGKLSFATKVIPAGRIFLRRLLDLAHSVPSLETRLRISIDSALDINWWLTFASTWNGTAFFVEPQWSPSPGMELYTDASSEVGFGAYWGGHWLQQRWPPALRHHSIQWKELYAIVMACEVWGQSWRRTRVLFHCDNMAVVQLWRSGLSKAPLLMHLVRALFFVAATNNFHVSITHIAGVDNSIADALSRFQMPRFAQLAPDADAEPTPTPAQLTLHSCL